jgi:hypothetical protein
MAEEVVEHLTFINGAPSTDGKAIVILLEIGEEKKKAQFAIPLQDVPTVIGIMLSMTIRASERLTPDEQRAIAEYPQRETPQVTSFALGPSSVENHETLRIRFGIIEIRVLLRADQMISLAEYLGGVSGKRH